MMSMVLPVLQFSYFPLLHLLPLFQIIWLLEASKAIFKNMLKKNKLIRVIYFLKILLHLTPIQIPEPAALTVVSLQDTSWDFCLHAQLWLLAAICFVC